MLKLYVALGRYQIRAISSIAYLKVAESIASRLVEPNLNELSSYEAVIPIFYGDR